MNIRRYATGLLAFLATTVLSAAALAVPQEPLYPAGLNPGDQFRIAFVTSTVRDATSSDIADYNAFVTAAANASPLLAAYATTWTAIGSTSTVDARDNTGTTGLGAGITIVLPDLTLIIATSYDDLWDGSLLRALNYNEYGAAVFSFVWTGSDSDGRTTGTNVLGDPTGLSLHGRSRRSDASWSNSSALSSTELKPLYGISDVLVVPSVDSPAALAVLAAGLAGIAVVRRRRVRQLQS